MGVGPGRCPHQTQSAGIDSEQFAEAADSYSLGRLYGLLDRLRHVSPAEEQDVFEYRYLVIQPNLDESVFKLWGQLPGIDGRIIEKALSQRETELPTLPETTAGTGTAEGRRFDLHLLDSLTGSSEGEGIRVGR